MEDDEKRPQFGNRFLTDPKNVFQHNAWDNVVWDEAQESEAASKVKENSATPMSTELQAKYEEDADRYWDEFYTQHQNRFFKDRHWLFTEFPELAPEGACVLDKIPTRVGSGASAKDCGSAMVDDPAKDSSSVDPTSTQDQSDGTVNTEEASSHTDIVLEKDKEKKDLAANTGSDVIEATREGEEFPGQNSTTRMLEVGCGVGNTVFPVLQTNNDPGLFVYCCDLSRTAIQLVQDHPDYAQKRCHAFVCDVSEESSHIPFPEESLDIVILIFVLSAIHPDKFQATVNRLARLLKPGGLIVFRDYGRYDLAQLRFKKGRCLSDNFYARGDGTRVYFFTQEELKEFFNNAGLVEEQNLIDRRLQVNRGRQLKMYRVWIQCKYRKPKAVCENTQ